jgi:hypothetical protein
MVPFDGEGLANAREMQSGLHARYLRDLVSIENKQRLKYLPKQKVAGSIPVARSTLLTVCY